MLKEIINKNYVISEDGEIFNVKSGKTISQKLRKDGYLEVSLWNNNVGTSYLVHRLVAEAFIPNPSNLPQVNHKDEDKTNNHVENLEWCTASYNTNFGSGNRRGVETRKRELSNCKPTKCIETNKVYNSIQDAYKETGIHYSNISRACRNKRKTAGGFHWEYMGDKNTLDEWTLDVL